MRQEAEAVRSPPPRRKIRALRAGALVDAYTMARVRGGAWGLQPVATGGISTPPQRT